MKTAALYYPFHLCHERTLERLLERYGSVHFRDYMALQLTPMSGTMASLERMGDAHQDLLTSGRLVQGYNLSGPLEKDAAAAIDRDLADVEWRALFHRGLLDDRRFQRGLFDLSHSMVLGGTLMPGPAALLRLVEERRRDSAYSVDSVRASSGRRHALEDAIEHEYGMALVKTSASLMYTIRLALQHSLEPITDSPVHFDLLERARSREGVPLSNAMLKRDGY